MPFTILIPPRIHHSSGINTILITFEKDQSEALSGGSETQKGQAMPSYVMYVNEYATRIQDGLMLLSATENKVSLLLAYCSTLNTA